MVKLVRILVIKILNKLNTQYILVMIATYLLMFLRQKKSKYIYFGDVFKENAVNFYKNIKGNILSKLGKNNLAGRVGNNPDVKVVSGKIVLTGTGSFKGKSFKTKILASDFFNK